jgi:hypothetical protein
MDKLWIVIVFLIFAGLVFFGIGAYCYHALTDLYKLFAEYGVPESHILAHTEASRVIFQLKAEVIGFAFFGILSWLIAAILVILLRKNRSQIS